MWRSSLGCTGFASTSKVWPFRRASSWRSLVSSCPENSRTIQPGIVAFRRIAKSMPFIPGRRKLSEPNQRLGLRSGKGEDGRQRVCNDLLIIHYQHTSLFRRNSPAGPPVKTGAVRMKLRPIWLPGAGQLPTRANSGRKRHAQPAT
jgi:hypothetical protein